MKDIEIKIKATVPDGKYCVDYNSEKRIEKCEKIKERTSNVGWGDGLGLPGTIIFYYCGLFDDELYQCYPVKDKYGLTLEKCKGCLKISS
jgi:hypothetical protein